MAHVKLDKVSVSYPIFSAQTRSLRSELFNRLGGRIAHHNKTVIIHALDNITFELNDGDRLGLVGHNGAGKTTLLRTVSRIYEPQSGIVDIDGTVSSLTDLTLGMDVEASGWDNIIFRCIFMGLSFSDARRLSSSIAEFTELGEYLDMPVRTYSTGMFLRLAFAISTAVQPDILVMDELISAGDAQFINKAEQRLKDLLSRTGILVIASHQPDTITRLCNKCLWLEHARMKAYGPAEEVLQAYLNSVGNPNAEVPAKEAPEAAEAPG